MSIQHTIQQGECINSIAFAHGLFPETVWNHADNAELKRLRGNPNVLFPGDVLVIPDPRVRELSKPDKQRHRFRRKGVPAKFKVQVMRDGEPRAGVPYKLDAGGSVQSGTTDSEGIVEAVISPAAGTATLVVGPEDDQEQYDFDLGTLDPVGEVTGAQARMKNLGIYHGEITGKLDEETTEALRRFQGLCEIGVTGKLDTATQDELRKHDEG